MRVIAQKHGRRPAIGKVTALTLMLLALAVCGPAATLMMQDYAVPWWTVDGGGDMFTSGGPFELSGTIGQHDAGVMTGGDFALYGGFWPGPLAAPCDPCDANCDGEVNAFDIEPFLDLLFGGGAPCDDCTGDANGDGDINAFDIEPFLDCLFSP